MIRHAALPLSDLRTSFTSDRGLWMALVGSDVKPALISTVTEAEIDSSRRLQLAVARLARAEAAIVN